MSKKVKSNKKKLKMEVISDPHLRRPEEFGVEGKTGRVGKDTMVVCTVIGAPPHRCCPQYHKSVVAQERRHRKKIIESGEFGTRSLIVDQKGFNFREIKKKKKKKKRKESEDSTLKKLAFGWSIKEATEEEKAQNKKSQEEGEKLAAVMKTKIKTPKKENKTKAEKKEIFKMLKKLRNGTENDFQEPIETANAAKELAKSIFGNKTFMTNQTMLTYAMTLTKV